MALLRLLILFEFSCCVAFSYAQGGLNYSASTDCFSERKVNLNSFSIDNETESAGIDGLSAKGKQVKLTFLTEDKNPNGDSLFDDSREFFKKRTSILRYQFGSKSSQRLKLQHQQPLSSSTGLFLSADVGATKGYYPNQTENLKFFNPEIEQLFFNKKYLMLIGYENIICKRGENGGLTRPEDFIDGKAVDEKTVQVKMNQSFFNTKKNSFYVEQRLRIPEELYDSNDTRIKFELINYTLWRTSKENFNTDRIYNELFVNSYFDTIATRDSMKFFTFLNKTDAAYKVFSNKDSHRPEIYIAASVALSSSKAEWSMNQMPVFRMIYTEPGILVKSMGIKARAYMVTLHTNRLTDRVGAGAELSYQAENTLFSFSSFIKDSIPPLFFFHTFSNHFIWEKDYQSIRDFTTMLAVRHNWKRINTFLGVRFKQWKNHHYLNFNSEPEVFNKNISLSEAALKIDYREGRWIFHSASQLQHSNQKEIIRQPELVQFFQVLFCDSVFKKNALLKLGPGIRWVSDYTQPSFNPALQEFYNGAKVKYGSFYQLNFSVRMIIHGAQFYLTADHLNAGWGKRNYFYAADYPLPGRMLRFGIRWSLED